MHKNNYGTSWGGGKDVDFWGDASKYGTICMASEHPKITSYIPRDILGALDKWREEHELDSRNAAIVAILADYLGVQHPVQLPNNAPLSIHLHTVLDELARISQRMDALEASLSTTRQEVPLEVSGTGQPERDVPIGEVRCEAQSTAQPLQPITLTQMALAKRLGCSDKAIEKHRKQGDKESFAQWSCERDPDNVAWSWEGGGGRGQALRFFPLN